MTLPHFPLDLRVGANVTRDLNHLVDLINSQIAGQTTFNALDYANVQDAIGAAETLGGGVVWFPPGTYHHNGLILTGATPIQLAGTWASRLVCEGSGASITVGDLSTDRTNAVRISGLLLDGGASHGIVMRRMHSAAVDNCRIRSFTGDGLRMEGAYASSAFDNYINNNGGSGVVVVATGSVQGTDFTRVIGNKILANAAKGVWVDNSLCASAGGRILMNDIEGNAIGLQMDAGSLGNSDAWTAAQNYFESQTGLNMSIGRDGGTGYFRSIDLSFNKMSGAVSATQAMSLDHVQNAEIRGNLFALVDFVVTANTTVKGWSGNINSGGTFPGAFPNGGASFDTLNIRQDSSTAAQIAMAGNVVKLNYPLGLNDKLYPPTAHTTVGYQTACGMYAGSGVPTDANGSDGDFYFRSDGTVGSNVYKRSSGAWAAIL